METVKEVYRAEGIVKQYPIGNRTVEILHGIDLKINQGEFVMLIGPSGCGKSTFMYLLFGLEEPTRGKVYFEDTDIFSLSEEKRTDLRSRRISMIHQQPIWIKSLTVKENVAFPLVLQQIDRTESLTRATKLLETLNLSHLADQHPHDLSVGEQQRCSFMRSLITNPTVIFADEPTGSLDTDSSVVVMEMFRKIHEELGKTIVMVTHNLSHLPYGTKIVSLLDGKVTSVDEKRPPVAMRTDKTIEEVVSTWKTDTTKQPHPTPTRTITTTPEEPSPKGILGKGKIG